MSAGSTDRLLVIVPGFLFGRPAVVPLAWALRRRGVRVRLFSYASRRLDLETTARALYDFCANDAPVNLVGYSLGGIVVADFCRRFPAHYHHAVTLGTPFQGSAAARDAMRSPMGRRLLGSAAAVLTCPPSGPAPPRFGIITGTHARGGILRHRTAGQGDGLVSTDEARLPGAADAIALPLSHVGLAHAQSSVEFILTFLHHGSFRDRLRGKHGRT